MTDQPNTTPTRSPSRRAVLKSGVVSAVATVATASRSAAANERSTRAEADGEPAPAERGALLPYQFRPGRGFTVVESDLEWQPEHLTEAARTHVVAYDHAPSFRAFVFTAPDETLERDRSFAFERTDRTPSIGADRRVVGVSVDPVD